MLRVSLRREWCKGCQLCIDICPGKVFSPSGETSAKGFRIVHPANEEMCTGCGLCEMMCPDLALTIEDDGQNR